VKVAMTDEPGTLTAGTGEFAGLIGSYTETWTVAGVDEAGDLTATVEIGTITRGPE
jgi:hydroxymethylglutaryl-CoA reductase